jgi:phosphoribosylanthranilate isomerase
LILINELPLRPQRKTMLQTKVKASAITHLTDARYFAAWEVRWLGFHLSAGSAESVDARLVSTLREWVDGVKICGEYNLATSDEILEAQSLLQLDSIQLGMLNPVATLQQLREKVEIIQELVIEAYADIDELEDFLSERHTLVDYFLLNFSKGGLQYDDLKDGIPISAEQLQAWVKKYPILVDLPLNDTSPTQFLTDFPVKGFAVQGGAEDRVGYKSFDELNDFFEDLEVLID